MTAARLAVAAAVAAFLLAGSSGALATDPDPRRRAKDPDPAQRAAAALALAEDGSAESARALVELFEDREPSVRDAAVLACGRVSQAAAVRTIGASARSRDDLTRRNAAEALGRTGNAGALDWLEALATKDGSSSVRAAALDALWNFRRDPKAAAIAARGAEDRDPFVRAAGVEAAGRIGAPDAIDVVRAALEDEDPGVRCVARGELKLLDRAESLATLMKTATDSNWRVRAQCVDDAAWLRESRAVDVLVTLVGDPNARVAAAAHRALVALSRRELGRDLEVWSAWWAANRDAWKPPLDVAKDARADPKKTVVRYHGLEVATDAAAFVVDLSASMKEPMGPGDARARWGAAAGELRTSLGALPDGFVAQIVFFQEAVREAFDRPQTLSRGARDRADAFLSAAAPGQRGNLLAGVLAAIERDEVDTVYLLTDGAPGCGDFVEKTRVRAAIRQVNRTRKCVIDTIGFGAVKAAERALLTGIAQDSGGRAVFR